MPDLEQLVDHVVDMATPPFSDPSSFRKVGHALVKAGRQAEHDARNEGLRKLASVIAETDVYYAGLLSVCCGAFVEQGGDPEIALEAIRQRTVQAIDLAEAFGAACRKRADDYESPLREIVQREGATIARGMPHSANAWEVLNFFPLALVSSLSLNPDLLAQTQQDSEFVAKVTSFAEHYGQNLGHLAALLSLLDEDIVVLHPMLRRGYVVHIAGVADNFELHTLLADVLIGEADAGLLLLERPSAEQIAAARGEIAPQPSQVAQGHFNLWNWPGLLDDGTLDPQSEYWIWNEGAPADIMPFSGQRVILLGEPPYKRTWHMNKRFNLLTPTVEIRQVLSEGQVEAWLEAIQKQNSPNEDLL